MRMQYTVIVAAMAAVAGSAWAQQQPSMNARELFYSPPPGAEMPKKAPAASHAARTTTAHARPKPAQPQEPVSSAEDTGSVSRPAENARPSENERSTPPVRVVTAAYSQVPLGMRYSVLKRQSDGRYDEVDADSVFHSGDKIRLNIEVNDSAYLYIVMKGSSGKWLPLFPAREISGGDNRVEKGRLYQIPPGDQGRFAFDEYAGEEKLFLVLSRKPEPDFEKLIYAISSGLSVAPAAAPANENKPQAIRVMMAANMPPIDDDLVSRIRSGFISRDLVFEKVDDSTPGAKKETAVYVVNPDRSPDARLVVDLKLKHQ